MYKCNGVFQSRRLAMCTQQMKQQCGKRLLTFAYACCLLGKLLGNQRAQAVVRGELVWL